MNRASKKTRRALDVAISSAAAHGAESDPDHEIGDLLELVEALFNEMTEPQRKRALLTYGEGRTFWGGHSLEGEGDTQS